MLRRLFVCLLVLFLYLPFSALAAVSVFDAPSIINTGAGPNAMAAGDFNGDTIPDLAVANSSTKISILLGNGTGGFNAGAPVTVTAPPAGITAVDFNGDALLDLAVTDASTSNIAILQGNGDGTFQAALNPAPVAGPVPKGIAAGDLNNDGKPELIVANSGDSTISVFNNSTIPDPDLITASPTSLTVPATSTTGSYSVSWATVPGTGVTYILQEATNATFTTGLRQVYSGTALTAAITGRSNGVTYYYRVNATLPGDTVSAWTTSNGCVVTIGCAAPATVTVPASDPDGAYSVSWAASSTAGVTYTLQEATNATFTTGLRQVYSGTALTAPVTGRVSGNTYYYQVRASKTGLTASAWTKSSGCQVGIVCAAPTSLTVPTSDSDGVYSVSWTASSTAGVTYTLQEATDTLFTAGLRQVYSGTALSAAITGRATGSTYYYRVRATKTGATASAWTTTNGCVVALTGCEAPATLTVPATNSTGSYSVSWTASTTAGVTYVLQEATNATFTTSLRQVYSGTAITATVTGRVSGNTYYYRVRATKTGLTSSSWTEANGCLVTSGACAPPTSLIVPTTDADGAYSVSWTASSTTGVTYVLQEATNATFTTGLRQVYSGIDVSAPVTGRVSGSTYYYRVRATKTGLTVSGWAETNGCLVGLACVAPTSLTVPTSDSDGAYSVSWTASSTTGVTYVLQEATDALFTAGLRQVYSGLDVTAPITGRANNTTYYYRVRATKTGYTSSTWTTTNSCLVALTGCEAPATLTVPGTNSTGSYSVSWTASTTAGVTYVLQEATNATFTTSLRQVYSGTAITAAVTGRVSGNTYYYRVRATKAGLSSSGWTETNGCVVTAATCAPPTNLIVPTASDTGAYSVSWTASSTTGVTYVLQEATNATFTTGLRQVYSGLDVTAPITGRANNTTYYYRVRATKTGLSSSGWAETNGCLVGLTCGIPASLTVPTASDTNSYSVSWTASSTTGVTYVLQEATNATFTTSLRQVYSGTLFTAPVTGRASGVTYYYRVRAIKTGLVSSNWQTTTNGCTVSLTAAAPASITVPPAGTTAGYTVTWGASPTTGSTYVLQEATNLAFTAGLRTAYSGTLLRADITGRTSGMTYYYRVTATKSGYVVSPPTTAPGGCVVTAAPCDPPTDLLVPAASDTGAYSVSWTPSLTDGVTYTLQEATNPAFTLGLRTAYSGLNTTAPVTGRVSGVTYYYQVRATKTNYTASSWTQDQIGCTVSIPCAPPTNVIVPPTNNTGSVTISWTAAVSPTTPTYILEEATDAGFTLNVRQVYTGTALTATATGLASGTTYFYRVTTTKVGYVDSAPALGSNSCTVTLTAGAPATITVPATSTTGDYSISWAASSTPGVTYILEESTDSFATAGTEVYNGTATSAPLTGRTAGTYYYRVMATKALYNNSAWTTDVTGCVVGP